MTSAIFKHDILAKDTVISGFLKTEWRRQLYKDLCHHVITPIWHKEKESSRRSRDFLYNKYKNNRKDLVVISEGDVEVVISKSLTEAERSEFIAQQDDPVCMGVILDQDEKAFLKLPQSITDHSSFNTLKMYTDTALMGSKLRMTIKNRLR